VRLKDTFAILNLCNTHNSGNIVCLNSVCKHINWKAHVAGNLNFIVNGEGLFKVIGRVHCKSGDILKMVIDTHNHFTALLEYVRDHPGEQEPER